MVCFFNAPYLISKTTTDFGGMVTTSVRAAAVPPVNFAPAKGFGSTVRAASNLTVAISPEMRAGGRRCFALDVD